MHELLDVANAFGTPLKVAWIVWLAWGVGQAFWYRRERANRLAPRVPAPARVSRRTPAVKRQKPAESLVPRLITPQHVDAAPKVQTPAPPASPSPAFDPSKAIVETFDPRDHGSLDAIVADMEAHLPRLGADATHVH